LGHLGLAVSNWHEPCAQHGRSPGNYVQGLAYDVNELNDIYIYTYIYINVFYTCCFFIFAVPGGGILRFLFWAMFTIITWAKPKSKLQPVQTLPEIGTSKVPSPGTHI